MILWVILGLVIFNTVTVIILLYKVSNIYKYYNNDEYEEVSPLALDIDKMNKLMRDK